MENEVPLHQVAQKEAGKYRANPDTVGIWSYLDPHDPETEYLVIQNKDQSAKLAIFRPKMINYLYGKIVFERRESGHPIRDTVFIDNSGGKRIVLTSHEF